jgi:uncharacterized protein (DUF952 family)
MTRFYKILPAADWTKAEESGVFTGSDVDVKDGFIHFSDTAQLRETAARYFAGQDGLVLVTFDTAGFGAALKWEPSRGGALFPHLYDALKTDLAIAVAALPWNGSVHVFPAGWDA